MSKKKGSKAKKPASSPKQTTDAPADAPSCAFVGADATGIRITQAIGIPICLENWTSFHEEADAASTSITIQEWNAKDKCWKIIETIRQGRSATSAGAQDVHAALSARLFPGKYDGERVLAVFKPAENE